MKKSVLAVALFWVFSPANAQSSGTKADWPEYSFRDVAYTDCQGKRWKDVCHGIAQKWDRKRDQSARLGWKYDSDMGRLKVRLQLWNGDRIDGDTVCVAVLFVDRSGRSVFTFHKKWGIDAKGFGSAKVRARTFTYEMDPRAWSQVATVSYGVHECNSNRLDSFVKPAIKAAQAICAGYSGNPVLCERAARRVEEEMLN